MKFSIFNFSRLTGSRKAGQFSNKKICSGVTLIEMLAFLFIFSVVTITFYQVWSQGTRYIILAKNRLLASALANEKMEIVKNLAFEDIAHTTSEPPGNLQQDEDVTRMGRVFHVLTQIKYEDDPFDGRCFGVDTSDCLAPTDYKYVKITVSWDGGSESISTSSRFVPAGIEQPDPTRGVLVINVTSDKAGGAPVPQSSVRIRNSDTGLDETHSTDDLGRLIMVGLLQATDKYEITLDKGEDWEAVSTLPPYPDTSYNPIHEHASVVASAVNTIDMFQNELATFAVKTADYLGDDVADISYYLKGGRQTGATPDIPPGSSIPLYSMDAHDETGASGEKNYGQISPGNYDFILEESGYKIVGINPFVPFSLTPGETKTLTVRVGLENVTSLLVKVRDGIIESEPGPPLSGAEVHLTNGSGYDETITTGGDGMAFFPVDEDPAPPPFAEGTYNVSITASGFNNYSGQITVNSNELKEEIIPLMALE